MWFEDLTGFREETPDQVRANLTLSGSSIISKANGRQMNFGRLETPSLAELRAIVQSHSPTSGRLTIDEVVGNAQTLHSDSQGEGAMFQVASQFNLLEMISPSVTPEDGITIYSKDPTQGPACAIAAGAGTIFRNYFTSVNGRVGQSRSNQIDCLHTVGELLDNDSDRLWSMRNGYALATEPGLQEITKRLLEMDSPDRDKIRAAVRIGLQWDTEVTIDDCGHLVSQAYCSALPVAYSSHAPNLWRHFASLVLEAAYEATLAAAVLNYGHTGNGKVYLTLLGGGAFGNDIEWILAAIRRALKIFSGFPLEVKIVSYGAANPRLKNLF